MPSVKKKTKPLIVTLLVLNRMYTHTLLKLNIQFFVQANTGESWTNKNTKMRAQLDRKLRATQLQVCWLQSQPVLNSCTSVELGVCIRPHWVKKQGRSGRTVCCLLPNQGAFQLL